MKRTITSLFTFAALVFGGLVGDALAQTAAPARAAGERVATVAPATVAPVKLTLPLKEGSVRFLAIGDTGTGTEQQQELANVMLRYRQVFPYEFVLMMGDNMYGGEKPEDFKLKFENVYKQLLNDKVKFYATLGNHDESNQRFYENFNMNGEEFYRFARGSVAF
jgi:hypothetical protein